MAGAPPEDRIRLWPALFAWGHEISLEVEIHGAWMDGTYVPAGERTPAVEQVMRLLYDLALQHRKQQQEGKI